MRARARDRFAGGVVNLHPLADSTFIDPPANGSLTRNAVTVDGKTWDKLVRITARGVARYRALTAALVNGETYRCSALIKNTNAFPVIVHVQWCDIANVMHTLAAGETRRVTTAASRATYDSTYRFMDIELANDGAELLITEPMITRGPNLYEYGGIGTVGWATLPGNISVGNAALAPLWPNMLSRFQSTLEDRSTVLYSSTGFTNHTGSIATDWCDGGTQSLALVANPAYTGNDIYATVGGDINALRLGMQAGKTYTFVGTCRLAETLTAPTLGFGGNATRALTSWTKVGAGSYSLLKSASAPNAPGITRLAHTFTVPAGATEAFLRLYHGGDHTSGPVYWDRIGLFEHTAALGGPPANYWVPGTT